MVSSASERGLRASWGMLLICVGFLVWRGPTMYRSPGGQDEECYAVPGLTILQTGLPQLPHIASRNLKSPYYRADEAVYLEPPLFFYAQSLLYAVLPRVYGTARLTSAIGGMILLMGMGRLAVLSGARTRAALWGAGLFMMSRWFYFNATAARPDTLCAAFGLLAILAAATWTRTRRRRWLIVAGVLIGLGGLTHPFALTYAFQIAAWTFLNERGWKRVAVPFTLAAVAMAVACLWLPLILQFPEVFEVQFRNQFVHERGGPLLLRILWPWESIAFHMDHLIPHINPWQSGLCAGGALVCLWWGTREERPLLKTVGWLAVSGVWLMCGLVGPHHPVFGYFSYPSALAFIGVGWGIDRLLARLAAQRMRHRILAYGIGACLVGSMLIGSGIRVNLAYLRNWNDIHFDAPRFARHLLERLPADATYLVDEEFALDFIREGRKTIAFRAVLEGAVPRSTHYDFRVAGRSTDRAFAEMRWDDELQWVDGDPSEPHGIYVKVYRHQRLEQGTLEASRR